jgi:ABC-type uncharacterized transport system substrate-binding protein
MSQKKPPRIITILFTAIFPLGLATNANGRESPGHNIQIVAIDESEATRHIVADLRQHIPDANLVADPSKYRRKNDNPIFIAIGPAALRSLLEQNIEGQIISMYTSSQAYMSILENAPDHTAAITAVYAEPSPAVQMHLISLLYKRKTGVAVILSSRTAYLEPILQAAAAKENTELTIEKLATGESINRMLNRVGEVSAILAMPDSTIFDAENIRNILISCYRRNQSVIGFSASLVKAGALASSYSDIEDIDAQLYELIAEFEASGRLPAPQFPKYFEVIINDEVARSLNIVVDESVRKFSRKAPTK